MLSLHDLLDMTFKKRGFKLNKEFHLGFGGHDVVVNFMLQLTHHQFDALKLLNLPPRLLEGCLNQHLKPLAQVLLLILQAINLIMRTGEPHLRLIDLKVPIFNLPVSLFKKQISVRQLLFYVLFALQFGI